MLPDNIGGGLMEERKIYPNVSGEIQEHITSKIKTWGGGLYASMIGDPCERYLYHSMVDWRLQKPRPPEVQSLFELGTHLEALAKQRLRDVGYEVFDHGDTLDEHGIRGKMDCFISGTAKRLGSPRGEPLKKVPTEIKFLGGYADKFETIWDLLNSDKRWVRRYPGQLLFYMYARNSELGLFLSFNKMNAWPQHIWVDFNEPGLLEIMEGLIQKAGRIHEAVKTKSPPPWIDSREGWCFDCDFLDICKPDIYFGPGAQTFTDERIVTFLDRYFELLPFTAEFEKIKKDLKNILNGVENGVAGPYLLTGKRVEVGPKSASDGYSFWKWQAKKVNFDSLNSEEEGKDF
jgi:hypothetical protein